MALNQKMASNIENLARRLVNATSGANGRPNFIRLKAEVNKLVTAAKGVAKLNIPRPAPNVRRQVPRPAPAAPNVRRQVQRPAPAAPNVQRQVQRPAPAAPNVGRPTALRLSTPSSNFVRSWSASTRGPRTEDALMAAWAASPEGKAAAAQEAANRARLNATKQKLKELDDALIALVKKVGAGVTANNKTTLQNLRTQLNTMRSNAPARSKNNFNGKNLQFAVINRYLNKENKAIYDAVKSLVEAVASLREKSWMGAQALSNNYSRLRTNAPNNYKNLVRGWYEKLSPRYPVGPLNR